MRVEARPETRRSTRDSDVLPASNFDIGSPISALEREAKARLDLLDERREAQWRGEEELRAVAEVRELQDSEIDVRTLTSLIHHSPSTSSPPHPIFVMLPSIQN